MAGRRRVSTEKEDGCRSQCVPCTDSNRLVSL
jgi:hypothetical protein